VNTAPGASGDSGAHDFARATAHHAAGRIDEAIAAYSALLENNPAHAELRYRLGVAYSALRNFRAAAGHLAEATRLAPQQVAAWAALGLALRELGELAPALDAFARARGIDPAFPQVNGQMGLVLQSLGRLDEAVERFAEEAARFPGLARNHNNLGMALAAMGREAEAIEAFTTAVRLDKDYLHAHSNLAAIFHRKGDLLAAEAGYRQVLRLSPDNAKAHSRLGHILTTMWRAQEAEAHLRRAMELDPDDPAPPRTLAYVLRRLNRVDEARAVAREMLRRRPDDLQAAVVDKLALPPVYESTVALVQSRERYARGLDELAEDIERYAADAAQVLSLAWENFHLAYQGGDDRPLQEKYARLLAGLASRAAPQYFVDRPGRALARGERIRVGFLSSFFRDSTVGKYFRSWVTGLDRSRFDVFVYYTGHVKDGFSDSLAQSVEHYRRILDSAPRVANVVIGDRLDVLVHPEVGMDVSSYLLAGFRLAPVQCAGWGHPVTTGQANIDWYLTCADMEPAGAEAHYSERLARLPGLGTRYAMPRGSSVRTREDLGLPAEGTLYLCPQSLFKIHPDNDALFARVLAGDPAGRLVFFRDHDGPLTQAYRARLLAALAAHGVNGASRTVFLERLGHEDYLRVNALCDVMLDTLHWSGGNTTLDAIAAELPLVTLPGAFMRGRQSFGMLRTLGLEETGGMVAADEQEYARLAVRLGTDRAWRKEVCAMLRERAGRLFDRDEPIAAFQEFLNGLAVRAD
jgi:predicted O-linked N-acetylglucosamine transferase (SPINDLY family)